MVRGKQGLSVGLHDLNSVQFFNFPQHVNDTGKLVVMEGGVHVPFPIQRVFSVSSQAGTTRGGHAHRLCSQLLICLNGAVDVVCNDGIERLVLRLDRSDRGLYIPPSIWAEQTYLEAATVLLVLCDRPYEEEDYLRDFCDFQNYRNIRD